MKNKIFGVLQRVGRSFMLPIAILPVAGLLLGLGASFTNPNTIEMYHLTSVLGPGTWLNALLTIMCNVGTAIFANLPIIFALGVAVGMAKKEKEVAALAAMVAFFVMHVSINAMLVINGYILPNGEVASFVLPGTIASVCGIQSLEMGAFGGILVGLGVASLHNKYYKIELPNALSFFGGSRFVPIVSTIVYMFVGILMFFAWPYVQAGIFALGNLIAKAGYFGTFMFGVIKRGLIPFGLHHVFYVPFWQTALGGTMEVAGETVVGAQNIIFAQIADPNTVHFASSATKYFTGEYIFMMFGLPGAALAMYQCARPEKKKAAGGLLFSAALTSILTGITEPIEFSFLFVAPMLFGVQVVLAASCYALAEILNITIGLTFSGGLIDFILFGVLQGNAKTNWVMLLVCGVVYFFLYYAIFKYLIVKYNFKTPGREADDEETKLYTKADYKAKKENGEDALSSTITEGLGGHLNIEDVDSCATRLRVTVKDASLVNQGMLKATGCSGVVVNGNGVQVIYGPKVSVIKSNLEEYLGSSMHVASLQHEIMEEEKELQEKQVEMSLHAPLIGEVLPLEAVEDGVFSSKMLGEGCAIEPTEGKLLAPMDGTVSMIFHTKHAIGLNCNGMEILLHMGIDTVQLNGQFFDVKVSEGQVVKQGELLAEFDMEEIKKAGYRMITPMIVTNTADFEEVKLVGSGQVSEKDVVVVVK